MSFDKLIASLTILFNVAAFAVFTIGFIRTKKRAVGVLAAALFFSLIPMTGIFFPREVLVLGTGEVVRTGFYYVSKGAVVLYFLLLTMAGVMLIGKGSGTANKKEA